MDHQKRNICLLLAFVSSFPLDVASAATNFQVTANVNNTCTITAGDLNFGNYTQTQLDGQSQITLTCTNSAQWSIGLNAGTFSGATVATRSMTGPGIFHLNYSLFTDPGRSNNWGNTVGSDAVTGVGNGGVQTLNVYGRIPATQNVGAGGYVDTITATITF